MKTQDKIVAAAVHQFNAEGISTVTSRHIAEAVGISHGNLTYHFPNKSTIVEAIYARMESKMKVKINPRGTFTLQHLEKLLNWFGGFREQYRFFFTDTAEILRNYPEVGAKHSLLMHQRLKEARDLIRHYVEIGLLERSTDPKEYDHLAYAIWFTSTFWLSQAGTTDLQRHEMSHAHSMDLIWNMIFPHLTQRGLVEYYFLRNINN